ncbi:MAG: DUF3793 family protein [Eubacterium sp.]|nr:DUF3793 family protein [Eubacterium sp.]
MSDEMIIELCSPTLAGIKTGNLFSCECEDPDQLLSEVRRYNSMFARKGICMLVLSVKKRALIYLFRPDRLKKDLADSEAAEILRARGYREEVLGKQINTLKKRLRESDEFPHEIGLFLGYPPGDVRCFIEEKARNYQLVGCWKAYGNVEEARKKFNQYKVCKDSYVKHFANGMSLRELTVQQTE